MSCVQATARSTSFVSQDIGSGATINVAFPAGAIAGDFTVIVVANWSTTSFPPWSQAWCATPAGWTTSNIYVTTGGANPRGSAQMFYKVLSAGDVSTGTVTFGPFLSGTNTGPPGTGPQVAVALDIGAITFIGPTAGFRPFISSANPWGSVGFTTPFSEGGAFTAQAVASDFGIYFTSFYNNTGAGGTVSISRGTITQNAKTGAHGGAIAGDAAIGSSAPFSFTSSTTASTVWSVMSFNGFVGCLAPPGFSLSAPNVSIVQGMTAGSVVTILPATGLSGPVTLSISGLPSGVSIQTITPNPTTGTAAVVFTAAPLAALGPFTLTVLGDSSGITGQTTFQLVVLPAENCFNTVPPFDDPSCIALITAGLSADYVIEQGQNIGIPRYYFYPLDVVKTLDNNLYPNTAQRIAAITQIGNSGEWRLSSATYVPCSQPFSLFGQYQPFAPKIVDLGKLLWLPENYTNLAEAGILYYLYKANGDPRAGAATFQGGRMVYSGQLAVWMGEIEMAAEGEREGSVDTFVPEDELGAEYVGQGIWIP